MNSMDASKMAAPIDKKEGPNSNHVDLRPFKTILERLRIACAAMVVGALPMYAMADTNSAEQAVTAEAQAEQILSKNQKEAEANYTLKAHKEMVGIAAQMCNKFDQDSELQDSLYSIAECMPKVKLGGELTPPYADTLDLTLAKESLKAFRTGNVDVVRLNQGLKELNNSLIKYEADINRINHALEFTQKFDKLARPTSELVHDIKTTNYNKGGYFWVPNTSFKEYAYGKVTKVEDKTRIVTSPDVVGLKYAGTPNYGFGNYEILTAMKASAPIVKKAIVGIFGAYEHKLDVSAEMRGSLHKEGSLFSRTSTTPYNQIHATFTITYDLGGGTKFVTSLFNNSNGYGGPDLRQSKDTATANYNSIWDSNKGYNKKEYTNSEVTRDAPLDANRLITVTGIQIPVAKLGAVQASVLAGMQYGYSTGNSKLSPAATFILTIDDKKSALHGTSFTYAPSIKVNGVETQSVGSWKAVVNIPKNFF